jgi:hypothetical protein
MVAATAVGVAWARSYNGEQLVVARMQRLPIQYRGWVYLSSHYLMVQCSWPGRLTGGISGTS